MKISFLNEAGVLLAANLDLPKNNTVRAYAIFAHCFTCSKNLTAIRNISRALNEVGIGLLRFDFTGLGSSEGDFENTNFSTNLADIYAAASYLEQNYLAPKILIGHSLGGAAVLFATSNIASIEATVTIGAPYGPGHITHMFKHKLQEIKEEGITQVNIGGRPFSVRKQFLDDILAVDVESAFKNMNKALLIFHSPQDRIVEIENASKIYRHAKHPKSFISLDGADHLLSDKSDSSYVGKVIASWVERYIE